MQAQHILHPGITYKGYTASLNLLLLFSPIPIEAILLLRIAAVYDRRSLFFLLPLPISLNLARIVNMASAIGIVAKRPWNFVPDWNHLAFPKVEWTLQLLANVWVIHAHCQR